MAQINQHPELSQSEAKVILSAAAQDSSRVFITDHAYDRMDLRGITQTQVLRVLGAGQIMEDPVWNIPHGSWELAVKGFDSGVVINLICAIKRDRKGTVVITVYY